MTIELDPPMPLGEAAVLAQHSRWRIAEALAARPDGMSVSELAADLGLHPNAIRRHLKTLAEAGLVASCLELTTRPGRPASRYRIVAAERVAASGHRELVTLLLELVRRVGVDEPVAEEVGLSAGRGLPVGAPDAGGAVAGALARLGFAPQDVTTAADRRAGRIELRLRHCPFRDAVSRQGGEIVCSLHRGLTLGVLHNSSPKARLVEFEPTDPAEPDCRIALEAMA